jgi:hypothetical protein
VPSLILQNVYYLRLTRDLVNDSESDASGSNTSESSRDPRAAAACEREAAAVDELAEATTRAQQRMDPAFMRTVFDKYAAPCARSERNVLSPTALLSALQEVNAPVLVSKHVTADDIFRRADVNMSGTVDFDEYVDALLQLSSL